MKRKTIAVSLFTILILLFICITGSSFSAFCVAKNKIELKSIEILHDNSILVTDKDGKKITKLKIKSSPIGVRPSTGEQDSTTNVPSTVNDTIGTEGAFGCFYLTTDGEYEIILKSIEVTNGFSENSENIFIGVLDETSEAISADKVGQKIGDGKKSTNEEIIVVVWLDGDSTNSIAGADISIVLEIKNK